MQAVSVWALVVLVGGRGHRQMGRGSQGALKGAACLVRVLPLPTPVRHPSSCSHQPPFCH